jgi:hypothetical protein
MSLLGDPTPRAVLMPLQPKLGHQLPPFTPLDFERLLRNTPAKSKEPPNPPPERLRKKHHQPPCPPPERLLHKGQIEHKHQQPPCPPPERLLHKGQIKHTKSLVPQPPSTPPPERLLQAKGKEGLDKKNKEDKKASGKKSEERQLELEARKMKLLETRSMLEESAEEPAYTGRRGLQQLIARLVEAGCPDATIEPYMQRKRCKVQRPETDP